MLCPFAYREGIRPMQPIYKNRNTQADKDEAVHKSNSEMGKTDFSSLPTLVFPLLAAD